MIVPRLGLTVFLAVAFTCGFCTAQESTVAAAADLQFAMQDVAARFQKETGKIVKPIYDSSGNFFSKFRTPTLRHGPLHESLGWLPASPQCPKNG